MTCRQRFIYLFSLFFFVGYKHSRGVIMVDIVVKAKIKDLASGYNVAGDFAEELDKQVKDMIQKAISRAKANGRRTVMAKDL